jgi:ADP-heptose:LPS heptosyltransferase/predicted SAM-dependent methyltransferase
MTWDINDPYVAESKKIVWEVAPYLRGRGLDLGAGTFKVLPHVLSVDNGHHEQFGHNIHPDIRVETCEKMDIFASQSMDFVYSSHLLEHIENFKAALIEWWRLVKVGGYMVLYLPHKNFYPNIGKPGANPDHKHDFLPKDIINAMFDRKGWDLVECQERNDDMEYSMLLIFKKLQSKATDQSWQMEKPQKSALVCRFGAFGDLMQASSVWAGLKRQGYHVTLMTSNPGAAIVTEDPNLDGIMLLDKDQVPNAHLGDFWKWQAKKYTKFVNLSESVEGSFLAMPGRTAADVWTPMIRHKHMNQNYVEHQHDLAGLDHNPVIKFYTTLDERAWARKQRARLGKFVVLWSLAGSSVHKTWAGLDAIIAALMLNYKDVDVVLCGGPEAAMLEAGWEKEPRVTRTCGKWSIRQTLAFAFEADLVIGPETGVLNSVANEPMPKVIFLSHSSVENLTRDWVNTVSLYGKGTNCTGRGNDEAPACHMMHYGWKTCTKDEDTGTAQCQVDISKEEVYWHLEQTIDAKLGIPDRDAA